MNINVQKVKLVLIKDETGKVIDRFELGMISTLTNSDKSITLEIQKSKKK